MENFGAAFETVWKLKDVRFSPMERTLALDVMSRVLSACESLNQALRAISDNGSAEELSQFRNIIAPIIAGLDLDILARIYREFPDLEQLDEGLHPK